MEGRMEGQAPWQKAKREKKEKKDGGMMAGQLVAVTMPAGV